MGIQSGNPAFAGTIFEQWARADRRGYVMTVEGTALKSLLLLIILTATAAWSWTQAGQGEINVALLIGSGIGALIVGFATVFNPRWAPVSAPIYAGLEGVLLGAISNLVDQRYPGIAVQAVALSFGTLFCMLCVYVTGLIRVTDKLIAGVTAATGAIALVYLVSWILGFFGIAVPFLYSSSPLGIGFSLLVVALAAFNLLLDFDVIEKGARYEAPKFMEWYGAFGLMVTMIWLYLEILRLLAKLRERED
ncbi:MAG: Bax inhibitor-1/YccA family protein [Isosphaeraceae bacterium]|nr:Bax inhibitor-1/YccA family protein [Isosphaeraceae bacterium]